MSPGRHTFFFFDSPDLEAIFKQANAKIRLMIQNRIKYGAS
jgi:hypothetical protein